MGKKNITKTQTQRVLLESYYETSNGLWQREQLEKIAENIGLTRQQVYKWLWDKRNIEKKKIWSNVKIEEEQSNFSDNEYQTHEFFHNNCCIKVPLNLKRAVEFIVDPSVSLWAVNLIRQEGWQLIALAPSSTKNMLVEQCLTENGLPMSKKQEMQLKEYESPQNIIKCSSYELAHEQDHENMPFFKSKSPNIIKQEDAVRLQHYSLKKCKSAPFLLEIYPRTVKKQPVFSPVRRYTSNQIYDSNQ